MQQPRQPPQISRISADANCRYAYVVCLRRSVRVVFSWINVEYLRANISRCFSAWTILCITKSVRCNRRRTIFYFICPGLSPSHPLFIRNGRINIFYRGPNVSILHLRGAADPWEVGSQGSAYSIGSNKSQTSGRGKSSGNTRGSYTRGTSIPSLKRHDTTVSTSSGSSLKQHRQDSHGQASEALQKFIPLFSIPLWNTPSAR